MIKRHVVKSVVLWAAALMMLSLSSCEHRELCYDHTHGLELRVDFDWSLAPDAAPRTMVVYLFPKDGGLPLRYEMADVRSSVIRVAAGSYDAVAFNGDTETLRERGLTYDDFAVTTDEQEILAPMSRQTPLSDPPRADEAPDEPVRTAPETLWSDCVENIVLLPARADQVVEFSPVESTVRYHITFENVRNLSRATSYSAALTSMCESYTPSRRSPSGRDVTVPLSLTAVDDNTLEGMVTLFGHCPDSSHGNVNRHILTVYTSDRHYFHFDVTGQIHSAENPHEIDITIDNLVLPEPPEEPESGMSPTVSDWIETIICDLDMN